MLLLRRRREDGWVSRHKRKTVLLRQASAGSADDTTQDGHQDGDWPTPQWSLQTQETSRDQGPAELEDRGVAEH